MDEHQHQNRHRGEQAGRRFRSRPRFPGEPAFDGPGGPGFGGGPGFEGGPEFEGGPAFEGEPGFEGGPGFPGRHGFHGPHGRGGFPGGPPGFGAWTRGSGRRGGRAKRGDVRAAALALLAEEPMNGYQIIQQISERSGGIWRPSPGSVYPALAQLEDENLIAVPPTEGGRRAYALTAEGRAYVTAHADEMKAPWSAMTNGAATAAVDMRTLVGQVHLAAFQVVSAGTDAQVQQARKVLAQARRALYRILADDSAESASGESASGESASGESASGESSQPPTTGRD
jgi:DNA-binding PadR family transcriptional regulator